MRIGSLEPSDLRSTSVEVAGTPALLIAKAHKIHDRLATGRSNRIVDKDASDVVRLMQSSDPDEVANTVSELLATTVAGETTRNAVGYLTDLFGRRGRDGIQMARRALQFALTPEEVEGVCTSYVAALTRRLS